MKTPTAIILAAVLASGCTTLGSGHERSHGDRAMARYEPYLEEPVRDFNAFRYDSWEPISRNQLVLWTSINDAYLLTVMGNCSDLPFAHTVRVTSNANTVSTLDSVIVRGWRCPISEIQPIDVRRMKADRRLRALDDDEAALPS